MEKVPWLILSAASCWITIAAQKIAISPLERLPITTRLPNALISYVAYLKQTLWPVDLAVFYPHPWKSPSPWLWLGALVLLAGISFAAFRWRRKAPYLLVGWLWYVVMLVPVIGLIQVGGQAMADRYTYLPLIGIFMALAWTARAVVLRWPSIRVAVTAVATLMIGLSIVAAWKQTTFWRDNRTLWTRALSCTPETALALNNLAGSLLADGEWDMARAKIDRAIEIEPNFAMAYLYRGRMLAHEGKKAEAIDQLKTAVTLQPNSPVTQNELAMLLTLEHRQREAIACLENVLKLDPDAVVVQENLAWVLATTDPAEGGDPKRAVALAERVCRLIPTPADDEWDVLAAACAADGRFSDATVLAQRALKIAVDRGKDQAAAEIRGRIKLYEAKKPYRQ